MNQAELAQARHRTYALLSQLFLRGATAELLHIMRQLPLADLAVDGDDWDVEQLQADHYSLFGLNLLPYETLFLTDERELGHETTQTVARLYLESGYRGAWAGEADHMGHELAFLAFLCGAEADAWADGQKHIAAQIQQKQADFVQVHVGRWVVPFVVGVAQTEHRFFTAVSHFLLSFVHDHTAVLPLSPTPYALPEPPDLLTHPDTRLKDIARYLLVPAYTGMVLTKTRLTQLGRALELPHGFGTRRQMLTTLLEGAGRYEQWAALVNWLQTEANWWQQTYTRLASPHPTPFTTWQTRLQQHQTFLTHLQTHAQTVESIHSK